MSNIYGINDGIFVLGFKELDTIRTISNNYLFDF